MAPGNFAEFVAIILNILVFVVPILFSIAILTILWSGAKLILYSDNPQERTEGKTKIFWGILLLFVMISMWGLVALLRNTFGI